MVFRNRDLIYGSLKFVMCWQILTHTEMACYSIREDLGRHLKFCWAFTVTSVNDMGKRSKPFDRYWQSCIFSSCALCKLPSVAISAWRFRWPWWKFRYSIPTFHKPTVRTEFGLTGWRRNTRRSQPIAQFLNSEILRSLSPTNARHSKAPHGMNASRRCRIFHIGDLWRYRLH